MSPQTKTFKVSSLLDSRGILVTKAPLLSESSVSVGINFSQKEVEFNHEKIQSGECFVISPKEVVLSINKKGELVCICPETVTPSISTNGELIFTFSV
ncbi:MAG: hypothetical protein EOM67_16190 [Spirochaetia bacterium]|nr:hypothetical protein [Spirochaetia bacterium]